MRKKAFQIIICLKDITFIVLFFCNSSFAAIFSDIDHIQYSDASPWLQQLMSAVPVIIPEGKNGIKKIDQNWEISLVKLKDKKSSGNTVYRLCDGERFSEDYRGNMVKSSGALISSTHVLVAGHSMDQSEDCKKKKFVFGFNDRLLKQKECSVMISGNNVYNCKKVTKIRYDGNPLTLPADIDQLEDKGYVDFAIIELDRPVDGVKPVEISKEEIEPENNDDYLMISSLMGLPVFAQNTKLISRVGTKASPLAFGFLSNSSVGSSGGIYLNQKGQIIGLHIASSSSSTDWNTTVTDSANSCRKWISMKTVDVRTDLMIKSEKRFNILAPVYSWAMPMNHISN